MPDDPRDEFFVGYLPEPPGLRRFVRLITLGVLVLVAAAAIVVAFGQRDPGGGVWNTDRIDQFEGVIALKPYPMLLTNEGALLIVGDGKSGVLESFRGMDGHSVHIAGRRLSRKSFKIIELIRGPELLHNPVSPTQIEASNQREIALRGEIVDPKCFLGAMKPGDGKTHKACATLCIRGGIPPFLIVADPASPDGFVPYLLVDLSGDGLVGEKLDALLPFVGEQVEVNGAVEQSGEVRMLRIDPDTVRRV